MGYDVRLEALRGTLIPPDEKQRLVEALRRETKLDDLCEVTVLRDGAYPGDARALSKYLEEGVLSPHEYDEFCSLQNLSPNAGPAEADLAARLFLNYKWGQGLVVASMPRDREGIVKAYRLMIDFARRHNLVVHDPQAGRDVDLENPGELPPMFRGSRPRKRGWFPWLRAH